MEESFAYMNAASNSKYKTSATHIPDIYNGDSYRTSANGRYFSGKLFNDGQDDIDQHIMDLRLAVVKAYRDEMKKQGFRG